VTGIDKAVEIAGSQAALAVKLGVSQQAISEWVASGYIPDGRIDDMLSAVDKNCSQIKPRDLLDPKLIAMMDRFSER
jgi:DNA-binding transcriptional regulator YdaS (Cro superfamily)